MAEHSVMLELEQASQIMMASPELVTKEQRQAAQDFILNFHKTRMPYSLCQYILDHSKNDYTLFQAATTIKEAIVRDWALMGPEAVEALRSFLLRYITNHITLQSYVREQILQTVAVILKRATLDNKGKSCDGLFEDVTALISSGNITMQLVACSMLTSLLNEYSYTSRTSNVGLTWEFHIKCKRAFEQADLKRVFMFSLQVLTQIESQTSPLSRETTAFLNRVLSIAEQVLSWEFTSKLTFRIQTNTYSSNPSPVLKPPESWKEILLDPNTVSLFFKIHEKARFNSEMAHHSMQCLVQLASLSGNILTKDTQTKYLSHFIQGFLQMLTSINIEEYENFGVACIFKNLLMMFPVLCFNELDVIVFKPFISTLTSITCNIGKNAAQEESHHIDDTVYMESYEKHLESWTCLCREVSSFPPGTLVAPAIEVFNSYMQCHLATPEGVRVVTEGESEEDIDEVEEDDRLKFSDQLCCIGALGRIIPDHSVPLLSKLLEDRVEAFKGRLHRLQQQRDLVSCHEASVNLSGLHALYEDLHWIVLVAGNLLADSGDGETPTIPSSIMKYSMNHSKVVDMNTSLKVMTSPEQKLEPGQEAVVDPVIRLITAVFRLCDIENRAVEAKLSDFISPQVSGSVMWFLQRWTDAYILHDEMDYSELSLALASAFGMDTDGVQWTMNFVLLKIYLALTVWAAEPSLMNDTLELLLSMSSQSSRATYLSQSEVLWNLVKLESNQMPPVSNLPPKARRQFMKAMVLAGCGMKSSQEELYWKLLLQSNHERFLQLVEMPEFTKGHEESCQKYMNHLESLIGVALATQSSIIKEVFHFMVPLLTKVVKFIDIHHHRDDIVTTSFELFSEIVAKMLPYLNSADSQTLYQQCLSAIQMFAKHNIGRQCISALDEIETKFKDIIIIMEMLTNLMSKDLLDFNKDEAIANGDVVVDSASVVIYGLELIVPIMSTEMLKFPVLCTSYFRLVSYLAELHADKLCQLPQQLFSNIMGSVELGFNASGTDVIRMLFDTVYSIAYHLCQNPSQQTDHLKATLAHFLKLVFKMLLLDNFDLSLQDVASSCLFSLICSNQDLYKNLVNELIQVQAEEYQQRLLQAFNELTPPSLQLAVNRQNKITFKTNFDSFLVNVRGFLCVR